MNILWHSNAPWSPSGYGNQTALFAKRLAKDHNLAVSGFFGHYGNTFEWNGIQVYPAGYEPYGNDTVVGHAKKFFGGDAKNGLVVTLIDTHVLQTDPFRQLRALCWTPVDHDPAPDHVLRLFRETDSVALAMSQHGQRALLEAGVNALYAPHGVDTSVFYPVEQDERMSFRRDLGWPESAFVVSMVAANKGNPSRKGFPQALMAYAEFLRRHSDSLLYLHTEPHGIVDGINLPDLLRRLKIPPDNIRFVDPYEYVCGIPESHLHHVYNASDVLLNPSMGEGFGIPIIEAQACGTPVIVTDWTSMTELAGAGWTVGGQLFYTNQRSWQRVPDVEQIASCLEEAYTRAHRMRTVAAEFGARYDADKVYRDFWANVIPVAWDRLTNAEPRELEFDLVGAEE